LNEVQTAQGNAYKVLKETLKMTNPQLLNYIKTKVLKNYQGDNVALNVQSPEVVPK